MDEIPGQIDVKKWWIARLKEKAGGSERSTILHAKDAEHAFDKLMVKFPGCDIKSMNRI